MMPRPQPVEAGTNTVTCGLEESGLGDDLGDDLGEEAFMKSAGAENPGTQSTTWERRMTQNEKSFPRSRRNFVDCP